MTEPKVVKALKLRAPDATVTYFDDDDGPRILLTENNSVGTFFSFAPGHSALRDMILGRYPQHDNDETNSNAR